MNISTLIGQTLTTAFATDFEVIFITDQGKRYHLYHDQDCYESVTVEDISGDLDDLVGSPIVQAEESTSGENPSDVTKQFQDDSFTWTFYRIATAKGLVVIRFYGESNGYYSESVQFGELTN